MRIIKHEKAKGWGDPWQRMGHSNDWSLGPLIGLDTETTSALPQWARIVTSAIVLDIPGKEAQSWEWISDPGIPIELGATAIHGINDEYVQMHGQKPDVVIREMLSVLTTLWQQYQCPLVTVNAPFDLTIMDREMQRLNMGTLDNVKLPPIIDTLCCDRRLDPYRRGRRTLTATLAAYELTISGAHQAVNDIKASIRLARKIADKYMQFATCDLQLLQELQRIAHKEWCEQYESYKRLDTTGFVIASHGWPIQKFEDI